MSAEIKEAFKIAFLTKLAEHGVSPKDIEDRINYLDSELNKQSQETGMGPALLGAGATVGKWGLIIPALLASLGGVGTAYGYNQLTRPTDDTFERLKDLEKKDLYQRLIAQYGPRKM